MIWISIALLRISREYLTGLNQDEVHSWESHATRKSVGTSNSTTHRSSCHRNDWAKFRAARMKIMGAFRLRGKKKRWKSRTIIYKVHDLKQDIKAKPIHQNNHLSTLDSRTSTQTFPLKMGKRLAAFLGLRFNESSRQRETRHFFAPSRNYRATSLAPEVTINKTVGLFQIQVKVDLIYFHEIVTRPHHRCFQNCKLNWKDRGERPSRFSSEFLASHMSHFPPLARSYSSSSGVHPPVKIAAS